MLGPKPFEARDRVRDPNGHGTATDPGHSFAMMRGVARDVGTGPLAPSVDPPPAARYNKWSLGRVVCVWGSTAMSHWAPRARSRWRTVAVIAVATFALAACAKSGFLVSGDLRAATEIRHVIVMPIDIELALVTAGGVAEPRADWTASGRTNMRTALVERLAGVKATTTYVDAGTPEKPLPDDEVQVAKLASAVGASILIHEYNQQLKLPTKPDKLDWTLGPSAKLLADRYNADHAMFTFVRDSYTSSGRVAVIVLAALFNVALPGGVQIGYASLVDLRTGKVVWFNRLARSSGDLRTAGAASETVAALLNGFPQ